MLNLKILYCKAKYLSDIYKKDIAGENINPNNNTHSVVYEGNIEYNINLNEENQIIELLDEYFEKFNNYVTNPIANDESEQIKRRSLGVFHTSMSVGDAIEISDTVNGKKDVWVCSGLGWNKVV